MILSKCVYLFFPEPYTEYKIFVKAYTNGHVGDASETVTQWTDISGPSPPIVTNLTCLEMYSLSISWRRPLEYYNTIDFYMITYRNLAYNDFQDKVINTTASRAGTEVCSSLQQFTV